MTELEKQIPISTVGRQRAEAVVEDMEPPKPFHNDWVHLWCDDSLKHYADWERPDVIISDGAYGILGFEGDTSSHTDIPKWYEAHIAHWSDMAKPSTTLWFWNSEIGWAAAHPLLEKYGWRYQNCNIWNKGMAHIAGNVNTAKIRRFPVVSEVCVQYVREVTLQGKSLKQWLKDEWQRSGLPLQLANVACGVKAAAVRKYFDQGHLWYFPPEEMFQRMQEYCNRHGDEKGKPYFSLNGKTPLTGKEWMGFRSKFHCPVGFTNVWDRVPVAGKERMKNAEGKALHLNQKPLDIMAVIIRASSDPGDVVWEPFGGLFTASLAAQDAGRKAFSCEINPYYYHYALRRFFSLPLRWSASVGE